MFNRFLSKTDFTDVKLDEIVKLTDGYSGAYIKELVLSATMIAIDAKSILTDGKAVVLDKHIKDAFNQIETSRNLDNIQEDE